MPANNHPNVLFIMADQWRYDWVGYLGAAHVRTPHVDRLAAAGMTFTHCCTNAPVCVPARTALASGLQPVRLGHLDNHGFLPLSRPTMYQQFRNAGYRTACVGKLDLAKPDPYNGRHGDRPIAYAWGFTHPEEVEGKMHAGRGVPPLGPYTHWLQEQGLLQAFHDDYMKREASDWGPAADWDSVLPTHAFADVYIGRRAAQWLRNVPTDFPFFQFVSFVGPHNPFDPPAEYAARFRDTPMPDAIPASTEGKPRWAHPKFAITADQIRHSRRQYAAAMAAIDDQVGEILAALDSRGLRDNTYVIFVSDHGEMIGDHGRWTKSIFYESALRVPLAIAGPGITPGARTDALVELIDLNPTCCELAGVPLIPNIDARSLAPILRGAAATHRDDIVSQLRPGRCIRTHTHKLIQSAEGFVELYDLQADPTEQHNIAPRNPDLVRQLTRRLSHRFIENGSAW